MVGDALSKAWRLFTKDLGAWLIYGLVFAVVATIAGSLIPVVGTLILLPLAMREVIHAAEAERAPKVEGMFQMQHIGGDLVTSALMVVAQTVGLLFCGVGWFVAWLGFFFAPELAAEARVSGSDAMRLSWRYVSSNLGAAVGVAVLAWLINLVGASLFVGLIVTIPLTFLFYACHWINVREQVYAQAQATGIEVKPRLTAP